MAIYHYHREIGKRGEGKNSVFGAAYIRGEKKTCDRTGEAKDFSNKENIVYKNCFLPDDAPDWANELRNQSSNNNGKKNVDETGEHFSTYAWNLIEFSEKRVDSQVYFHDDIAIPNSLSEEDAIDLVSHFVKNHLSLNGVFCDVAIHWDDNNHHAHVLMPLRTFTDTGFSKKIRRTKAQLTQEVKRVREAWSYEANQKLQSLGLDERIDHRSYKDRGIDLVPTVKVGRFNHFPDQSIALRKLNENEAIRKLNADAISKNPMILADKIKQERMYFDSSFLVDEINRYVSFEGKEVLEPSVPLENTDLVFDELLNSLLGQEGIFNEKTLKKAVFEQVDSDAEFQRIYNKIISNDQIFSLGLGEDGREHFVGRHAFDLENNLLKETHHLASRNTFNVSEKLIHEVSLKFKLNKAQQSALTHLTRSGNMAIVCGYAGTGKTYMLKAAKEVWEQSGFKMIGLSTSGKAASGLESETGIYSQTISSFLTAIKNKKIHLDQKTIVIMDEMGMTSLDDMSAVVNIVNTSHAKLAGVGDIEQTQPVGRGAPQRAMVDCVGAVYLDTIIRQETAWQREATILFETNKTTLGFDLYEAHGCIHLHETTTQSEEEAVSQWYLNYHRTDNGDLKDFVITAFKNETVDKLNLMAREVLLSNGLLNKGKIFKALDGNLSIAIGERLICTRNDKDTGFKNGDFATVVSLSEDLKTITVQLDNGKTVSFQPEKYNHIKYGYAATVHKLQGHTVKECTVVIDGQGWDRHKFLVAATRHKLNLNIYAAKEHYIDLEHLKESVSRYGLNDILTDFPVAFAERRGFDLNHSASMATRIIQKGKAKIFDAVGYLFNYQKAIEQAQSSYDLSLKDIEARRKKAVLVAEFCDNRVELATLIKQLTTVEDIEKEVIQKSVYNLQVRNGEIASLINSDIQQYTIALERNKVSSNIIESSSEFYKRHHFVSQLIQSYQLQDSVNPKDAFTLIDHIKKYYGSICQQIQNKEPRNAFLRGMEKRADLYRREHALEVLGLEHRAIVNAASRYKSLDHQIGDRLKELNLATKNDKQALHQLGITRDAIAHELISHPLFNEITTLFSIKKERVEQHDARFKDRMYVETFSIQPPSTSHQGNLVKQAAAHRIKTNPKRYGIYVDEFLKDGWKTINLENWAYQKRLKIANSSKEFKISLKKVQRYKVAASNAYLQWKKAIECSKRDSQYKIKNFKKAQGLSWKRSLLAHELMETIHKHVAALSMEKVDTTKLYQQALQVDYLNRYRMETREPLKLRMAKHINNNLKDFQAGLSVYGLYEEVRERATHYAYLQRIKNAPSKSSKALIRLALDYQDKKIEAAVVWGQVKTLKQLKIDSKGLALQAKQLMMQRNKAAYDLLNADLQQNNLTKEITGINLDIAKLKREAKQFIAQNTIIRYLASNGQERGQLATELLNNKASYHLLCDNNISFKTLNKEVQQLDVSLSLNSSSNQRITENKPQPKLWNINRITEALMNNPIDTYTAILGEPKEYSSNHLRYSGGLIISTKGSDSGKWYSFTEEMGGTPLSAIQKFMNLSFTEALEYGASLAGLSEFDAKISQDKPQPIHHSSKEDKQAITKLNNGITSAQSIWHGTEDIQGSLAERYFLEHRGIDSLEGMEIRYWPKGAIWTDFDEQGAPIEKVNKIPAAVISARNMEGKIVSVQRIYLDEKTAEKNTYLKDAKLTKGSNKGSPGLIQKGETRGVLYIAEGPETAASIATLDKNATVLVSFSVSNIANMAEVIKTYSPQKVIIAADNDGHDSASRKTTEKACDSLRNQGIDVRIAYPKALPNRTKTDWNDILVHQGKEGLHESFEQSTNSLLFQYEKASLLSEMDTIAYFKNESSKLDLSDIRYIKNIKYKEQSVCALLVPRTDSKGLLCGETVFALSADGSTIIGEGVKQSAKEGFYVAQHGKNEVLIIADTLLNAKLITLNHPNATVILARPDEFSKLHNHLNSQQINPEKIILLTQNHTEKNQTFVSNALHDFYENKASIYLMDIRTNKKMTKIDPELLEKSRLKMSFEQLINKKPSVIDVQNNSPQKGYNSLKNEYPILAEYEKISKEIKLAQGYVHEQLEKRLLSLAKEIVSDKQLKSLLQQDIPKLYKNIIKRIELSQNQDRGIHR